MYNTIFVYDVCKKIKQLCAIIALIIVLAFQHHLHPQLYLSSYSAI